MIRCCFFFVLIIFSISVRGADSGATAFKKAASDAIFFCEVSSSVLQKAKAYASPRRDEFQGEASGCVKKYNELMLESLRSIPNSDIYRDAKGIAKTVYAAWINYGEELSAGLSDAQRSHSPNGTEMKKQLSLYKTELLLIPE